MEINIILFLLLLLLQEADKVGLNEIRLLSRQNLFIKNITGTVPGSILLFRCGQT